MSIVVTENAKGGLDHVIQYVEKVEQFRALLESKDSGCTKGGDIVEIETGRKFDKVYIKTKAGQKLGRYMVDRNSWEIYGIKSWAQINPRRTYGTLDSIMQYDWSGYYGAPIAGSSAEQIHTERESQIASAYKKRGRPKKK